MTRTTLSGTPMAVNAEAPPLRSEWSVREEAELDADLSELGSECVVHDRPVGGVHEGWFERRDWLSSSCQ